MTWLLDLFGVLVILYFVYMKTEPLENDVWEVVSDKILQEKFKDKFMTKNWYQSKTVWFNIIVFIVGFGALPQFVAVLPVSWLPYVVLVGAVGNYILRVWFTSTPISATPQ
jgi:hypothetical protein